MKLLSWIKKAAMVIYTPAFYHWSRFRLLHDPESHVKTLYKKYMGCDLDLQSPQTLTEKLNWLKVFWYDPVAFECSDKLMVREYVKRKNLGRILNELYCVWDDADDIDLTGLPEEFVLKTTHDSGHIAICTEKARFDLKAAKRMFRKAMRYDYCFFSAEWPYQTNRPRIICERLLKDEKAGEIFDYKFYCFNGKPFCIFFASDRKNHVKADYYDLDWNLLPFRWRYEPSGKVYPAPQRLKEMTEYARILSEGFPFVRVDFYEVNGNVYFGELTFFHGGGYGHYQPEEMNLVMGREIVLPEKSKPWEIVKKRIKGNG